MTERAKFKLSRLRVIGWHRWDPIGLNDGESTPTSEYDAYLLQAAGKLWSGAPEHAVAEYLIAVERNLRLDHRSRAQHRPGAQERARQTVRALAVYAAELRS
jgi:hypothetical protein